MKISGIICEYNPFHNGHLHHIRETRKNGATHIVAVMSGNFVQRGDVAVMDKLERANLAVKSGADLVIELPVQYCLSSAENYAMGAVHLLNALGCVDELSFGSECGDIEKLIKAADISDRIKSEKADEILRIMKMGYTYPRALSSVIKGIDPEVSEIVSGPNNTLAIEYLRALKKTSSKMVPFTVKRESVEHDSPYPNGEFASASWIREKLSTDSLSVASAIRYMPEIWVEAITRAKREGKLASLDNLERVMIYKLRSSSPAEVANVYDVAQGLEHRIYEARNSGSLDELLFNVKNKRYTMARVKRILLSLLVGITKEDMKVLPPYGRILAINFRGTDILGMAKKNATIPFDTSIKKLGGMSPAAKRFANLEIQASDLFGLALSTLGSAESDYRAKISIDME